MKGFYMKVYQVITSKLSGNGFLGPSFIFEKTDEWTALNLDNLPIFSNEEIISEMLRKKVEHVSKGNFYTKRCEEVGNKRFVVEIELNDLPLNIVLKIMIEKLKLSDVKYLCDEDEFLRGILSDYLKGINSKNSKKDDRHLNNSLLTNVLSLSILDLIKN